MTDREKKEEFLKLLEPVLGQLSGYAMALTRNREDSRDLVSDTILAAFENFTGLKKKESFKSFVFTIASRHFKRGKWRRKLFKEFNNDKAELMQYSSDYVENNVDVKFLYNSLNKLKDKYREAIVLFEISGFTLDEIKDIQGGTISGVKSRLKRGREKLEKIMRDDFSPKEKGIFFEKKNGKSISGNLKEIIELDKICLEVKNE
ncbi:MAG: sigma-70 family RNA polymerase sigma factor [Ignavibacteriae bacterium]|nr:sigma-70 family RNA polymerase sigma factor [Ignavibacteriota bacterium]